MHEQILKTDNILNEINRWQQGHHETYYRFDAQKDVWNQEGLKHERFNQGWAIKGDQTSDYAKSVP